MAPAAKRYKLQYLPLFWDDLNAAVSFISEVLNAPLAAEKLLDRTESGILEHLENPTAALVFKSTRDRHPPYYWFEVGSYMVFYVVFDRTMEVRRFIYNSRDLTKMLP